MSHSTVAALLLSVQIVAPDAASFRLTAFAKATASPADSPSPRLPRNPAETSAEAEASRRRQPKATRPDTQEQSPTRREVHVTAKRYAFSPSSVEVFEGDVVKVTLVAEDIPHSFTIDDYRIAKRANPGRTVIFEFHADQAGTFPFYCNLALDEGCRAMRGQLVVRKR